MIQMTKTPRPFTARATQIERENGWHYQNVEIFDGDREIGSYERNYGGYGETTFEPFEINGAWYALYSRDYTSTRVMSLPDCRDLGGEEPDSVGFCPVELFVPRYREKHFLSNYGAYDSWVFESCAARESEGQRGYGDTTLGPWQTLTIGFVAGCVWGDDGSWKLEVFDLSRASDGLLTRSARFGYLELAPRSLCECLRLHKDGDAPLRITIERQQDWEVASGKLIDRFD